MNPVTNTIGALETFFGGFGLPVYPEDSVPDRDGSVPDRDGSGNKVKPPYVTVQLIAPTWRSAAPFFARVWYRATDYAAIAAKVDEIAAAIGECAVIPTGKGAVYLYAEDPFCQFQPLAGDTTLKCAYLSLSMQAITQ